MTKINNIFPEKIHTYINSKFGFLSLDFNCKKIYFHEIKNFVIAKRTRRASQNNKWGK